MKHIDISHPKARGWEVDRIVRALKSKVESKYVIEGCVPSQSHRRDNSGVLEDIRFITDQIMYDTLSEGKRNNSNVIVSEQLRN